MFSFKLGGLVLLIEGTGRNPDTAVGMFNALATISYDETARPTASERITMDDISTQI
jgi:hypothetical protein